MIYLRTGANGTGKTLLTLRDVREKSLAESRPVYHNGRFEIVPGGPLDGWQKIDFKDWQTVPDGAIFIIDECHNDLPLRPASAPLPEAIKMLAEHRRRGFDFYLITQHPMNIDPFVRRLIGSPGWHQHLKRVSGAPLVSVLEWAGVNDQPQKNGSGATAAVKMVPYPKEVYTWYVSTSLDTAKVKIPFQVIVLAACFILIPLLVYYGWQSFKSAQPKPIMSTSSVVPSSGSTTGQRVLGASPTEARPALSAADYAASYQPRIEGLAYTAPRYDDATKPINVPYPAACISMGSRCECYTQQATKLPVPLALCSAIVKGGFFNDWQQALTDSARGLPVRSEPVPVPTSRSLQGLDMPAFTVAVSEPAVLDETRLPARRLVR